MMLEENHAAAIQSAERLHTGLQCPAYCELHVHCTM